jgi:hypothetical protein
MAPEPQGSGRQSHSLRVRTVAAPSAPPPATPKVNVLNLPRVPSLSGALRLRGQDARPGSPGGHGWPLSGRWVTKELWANSRELVEVAGF